MKDIQDYFSELRNYGYCDDDIWAEDNKSITKEVEQILKTYKQPIAQARRITLALIKRNYVKLREGDGCLGFTLAYLVYR